MNRCSYTCVVIGESRCPSWRATTTAPLSGNHDLLLTTQVSAPIATATGGAGYYPPRRTRLRSRDPVLRARFTRDWWIGHTSPMGSTARCRVLLAGTVLTAGLALVLGRSPLAASAPTGVGTCPAWVTSAPTRALPFVAFASRPVAAGPRIAIVAGSAPRASALGRRPGRVLAGGSAPNCAVPQPPLAGAASRIDAVLDRLRPASRYRFRLAARTARSTAFSGSRTFTTLPAGRIPDGVVIGKVGVGRMTSAAAHSVLAGAYAKPLRFTFAGAFWHVAPANAGLRVGLAAAIHDALAATPGETLAAPALTVGSGPLNAYVAGLGKHFGHGQAQGDVRLGAREPRDRHARGAPGSRGHRAGRLPDQGPARERQP